MVYFVMTVVYQVDVQFLFRYKGDLIEICNSITVMEF